MRLIDLHCDTLYRLRFESVPDIKSMELCANLSELKKAGTLAQFFACYTNVESTDGDYDQCYQDVLRMIEILETQCDIFQDELALAKDYDQILENEKEGKVSGILTVEEGGILNGRMERLEILYKKGVRLITLMWNYENCLGYPNSRKISEMKKGLKSFGVETVKRAAELGMILDVSHASDQSFWDILTYADGPVVASHSNCRELSKHPRNLSDDMIRALAKKGGIAGLNFYGPFLGIEDESRLEDMASHIQHMIKIGGEEFPAIGTDFDGFGGMKYQDIPSAGYMERLWEYLKKQNFSERILDKIWHGNAERILKEI